MVLTTMLDIDWCTSWPYKKRNGLCTDESTFMGKADGRLRYFTSQYFGFMITVYYYYSFRVSHPFSIYYYVHDEIILIFQYDKMWDSGIYLD